VKLIDAFRAGGFNMFILLAIGIVMVGTAVKFARNADPTRLSLIRSLTIAQVACTITGFMLGLGATAMYVVRHETDDPMRDLLMGFAESISNIGLGGLSLVLTWILVAVGIRRMPSV